MRSLYEMCLIFLNVNINLVNFCKLNKTITNDLRNIIIKNHSPDSKKVQFIRSNKDIGPFLVKYYPESYYVDKLAVGFIKNEFGNLSTHKWKTCMETGLKFINLEGYRTLYYDEDKNSYSTVKYVCGDSDYNDIVCKIFNKYTKSEKYNNNNETFKVYMEDEYNELQFKNIYLDSTTYPDDLIKNLIKLNYIDELITFNCYQQINK